MTNHLPGLHEIETIIRRLGVTDSHRGLGLLARAVAQVLDEHKSIHAPIKGIYAPVARECSITTSTVEREIRAVREFIWRCGGRDLLEEIAGHPLAYPPTNSQLIAYIAHYCKRLR